MTSDRSQPDRAGAEQIARAGIEALRGGDARTARQHFKRVIAANVIVPPWFLLAQACHMLGDRAGEDAALDHVLAAEPRHIGALILKGDAAGQAGDRRAASSFYRMAMGAASVSATPITAGIADELARVQRYLDAAASDYNMHLRETLADAGFDKAAMGPRVSEALDILSGDVEVFLQQPTAFFFPRLPHVQFYEREAFDWVAGIEAAAPQIEAELRHFLAQNDSAFRPYVEAEPNRPRKHHSLYDDPKWSALHLSKGGKPTEHAQHFPATLAAVAGAPLPQIVGRSPMTLFSLLRPGTHIEPHNGLFNTRLICHLPLIVPPGCAFRVGNETRSWESGKLLIFDDSIQHEAWNRSQEKRFILLFEIWRPELTADERGALTTMFEAIDSFGEE
jgi:hypothetical protein